MAVTKKDEEYLSSAQQAAIQSYSDQWAAAKSRGDTEGMKAAHDAAEAIRNSAGYKSDSYGNYAGSYGTGSGSSGSTGSSASRSNGLYDAGTDYKALLDSAMGAGNSDIDYLQSLLNSRMAKEQDPQFAKYADPAYNATVQSYINSLKTPQIDLDQILNQINNSIGTAPKYDRSTYNLANSLAQKYINMDYDDWLGSEQYGALADRYGRQGKMTMQDILGQISSRTGGLASSYATTAANQQYNEYMAQLEEIARQAYANERADVYNNVQAAYDMSDRDYQRYLDSLSQYDDTRSFAYQVLSDAIANSQYNQEWQNTLKRQAIEDQRYADETQYGRGQNTMQDARSRVDNFLATGGRVSDLDPALIANSGYSTAELTALEQYYAGQNIGGGASTTRSTGTGTRTASGKSGDNTPIETGSVGNPDEYREIINRITSGYRDANGNWMNYTVDDIRQMRAEIVAAYGEDAYNNLLEIAQMGM